MALCFRLNAELHELTHTCTRCISMILADINIKTCRQHPANCSDKLTLLHKQRDIIIYYGTPLKLSVYHVINFLMTSKKRSVTAEPAKTRMR